MYHVLRNVKTTGAKLMRRPRIARLRRLYTYKRVGDTKTDPAFGEVGCDGSEGDLIEGFFESDNSLRDFILKNCHFRAAKNCWIAVCCITGLTMYFPLRAKIKLLELFYALSYKSHTNYEQSLFRFTFECYGASSTVQVTCVQWGIGNGILHGRILSNVAAECR